ncbi:MAG: DUF427 domain-containing protein [Sporichthyaceae bacterium]
MWDYPRPPRLEQTASVIEVVLGGVCVVRTERAFRVLETSHPPSYYLPAADFAPGSLRPAPGQSLCEWKGAAAYFDVMAGSTVARAAAWGYPHPTQAFEALLDHVAVYAGAMDRCTVDGDVVLAQPGNFYGGWITSTVVGPFKGEPGSKFW